MIKEQAIIVDIDGTLANIEHRIHHLRKQRPSWKDFFEAMSHDKVHEWCRLITNNLPVKKILVSGRPNNYETATREWLKINDIQYDELWMRASGDHRPDVIVKKELYEQHIAPKYEVVFVVDDRAGVVQMWRELGLVCLQCDVGDF